MVNAAKSRIGKEIYDEKIYKGYWRTLIVVFSVLEEDVEKFLKIEHLEMEYLAN